MPAFSPSTAVTPATASDRPTWHVTVAAVVCRQGRYLLIEEKTAQGLVINQPAGHCETGESLTDAVRRETLEESGYAFTPTALVGVFRWLRPANTATQVSPALYLRFAFAGEVGATAISNELDPAINAVHWLTRDEIATKRLRSPMVMATLAAFDAGQRYPLDLVRDLGNGDWS